MISKRLFSLFRKDGTILQPLKGLYFSSYLKICSNIKLDDSYGKSNVIQNIFYKQEKKQNSEEDGRNNNGYTNRYGFLPIVPLLAIMALKLNKASCLFGSSKKGPEVVS